MRKIKVGQIYRHIPYDRPDLKIIEVFKKTVIVEYEQIRFISKYKVVEIMKIDWLLKDWVNLTNKI